MSNPDEVICPKCVHQFRAVPVNVQERIAELEAALDVALDALIWTTGSGDFGEGGIAHEGALKCLYPAINMLKELKK